MPYLIGIMLSLFMVIMQLASISDINAQTGEESEAELVLNRYLDALSQGDILTMKSLMSDNFLERRHRLLDNPAYPEYLVETFGTASFSIVSINALGKGEVEIDAIMTFGKDDIIMRRYLMHRKPPTAGTDRTFLIHMESDSP